MASTILEAQNRLAVPQLACLELAKDELLVVALLAHLANLQEDAQLVAPALTPLALTPPALTPPGREYSVAVLFAGLPTALEFG